MQSKVDDDIAGTTDTAEDASGAGAASLAGYEYQIDVSVWLALDLVLVSRQAEDIVLEPASQEDLEAVLADSEPGRLVSSIPMMGYTLIVQAKRRSGDAWTPTTLKSLLEHGSEKRVSAAKRLIDPNSRYLLVTSAGVNGDARKLKQRRAGTWPKPDAMPSVIANAIDHDISGRISIIANQDDERLRTDIDRLLNEGCRIPNGRLAECRTKLREDARARIARAGGGRWKRKELEAIIREYGGYLSSTPELENYVYPNNWNALRATMERGAAAIIIGQSGTGKTLATKKLYDDLRKEMPGLTRVPIRLGPSQLRDDATPSPVLYDIEDPWGRFDFDPKSHPWSNQLGDFLASARPDRMIIATSRLDVAQASGVLGTVKPWVVALEAENYGKAERKQLYRSRIDGLPRDLQSLARDSERRVLEKLATPFEIQKFFDAMRTEDLRGPQDAPRFVAAAIEQAHQNSIEQTVIEQIEGRDDVRAATVVWALLAANDKVTRLVLREIEDALADIDRAMEKGISPLVDFFVAARNLRQSDGAIITYYHPRVEAGITRTLEKHRQVVRQTLRRLIDFLVSDSGPGTEWGAGTAARMLANAGEKFSVKVSNGAAAKIDAWLEARLVDGGKAFETHLELAARAGSAASNVAETARFLLHRPDRSFSGMFSWERPELSLDWYHARKDDASTKPLVEKFIRLVLPQDRTHYPSSFVDELFKLSSGLEAAFLEAARTAVHYGYIASDDAIAHGALKDAKGFEAVVDMAIEVLTPSEDDRQKAAELHLDIVNDVYSDDYAAHLSDNDDGYTASEFLKAYVEHVRGNAAWQSLARHRHADRLRPYWLRAIAEDSREGRVNDKEFAEAFRIAYGTKDEDELWGTLLGAWNDQYRPSLESRVCEGSANVDTNRDALACLLEHAPQALDMIVANLAERGALSRIVEICRDVAYLRRNRASGGAKCTTSAEVATERLPPTFRELCAAEVAMANEEIPVVSEAAREVLATIPSASSQVRTLRLKLDAFTALPVEDDVRWALETSDHSGTAVLAVEAAIRHGMTNEVESALNHRFAHAAACALLAIASPLPAPLPDRLLGLASHRASPVRRALVEVLKTKPHPAHQSTLVTLADDKWSKSTMNYGADNDDYPIAQAAIAALCLPLRSADKDALFSIAIGSSDPDVRRAIFLLLASSGVAMQRRIFKLAVEPGRVHVRRSAAYALLNTGATIDQSVVDKITPALIATRYEPVAAVLAILLGWRGDISAARAAAEVLATTPKRRVFVLLIVWLLKDHNELIAKEIAEMLPPDHKAVAWALGNTLPEFEDELVADLGDTAACSAVLFYMRMQRAGDEHKV